MDIVTCKNCISFQKKKKENEIIFQNWCQRIKRPIALIPVCYVNNLKKSSSASIPFCYNYTPNLKH